MKNKGKKTRRNGKHIKRREGEERIKDAGVDFYVKVLEEALVHVIKTVSHAEGEVRGGGAVRWGLEAEERGGGSFERLNHTDRKTERVRGGVLNVCFSKDERTTAPHSSLEDVWVDYTSTVSVLIPDHFTVINCSVTHNGGNTGKIIPSLFVGGCTCGIMTIQFTVHLSSEVFYKQTYTNYLWSKIFLCAEQM